MILSVKDAENMFTDNSSLVNKKDTEILSAFFIIF